LALSVFPVVAAPALVARVKRMVSGRTLSMFGIALTDKEIPGKYWSRPGIIAMSRRHFLGGL
jgi:hypothetical protein